MAEMSAYEQLVLELMNRARLDPLAEAARLGIDLNKDLPAGTLDGSARQVLAGNPLLNDAASSHTDWMLATDIFSHTGAGGSSPGDRMSAAGYQFTGSWSWGENISWNGTPGTLDQSAAAQQIHDSLFKSAGHRLNILDNDFREAGVGLNSGQYVSGGVTYNAMMGTEVFAQSGSNVFVTGVSYSDLDGDNFYDIGEGAGGRTVTVNTLAGATVGSDVTEGAGGYAVATGGGTLNVTFSGGGLPGAVSVVVSAGTDNAKVDLVDTDTILSSATARLSTNAHDLVLLGVDNLNGIGNGLANDLTGNKGVNRLDGKGGNDVLDGNLGRDFLTGGAGRDTFDFNEVADSLAGAARDRILDFNAVQDRIDVSDIDANVLAAGAQDFVWRDTGAFTGTAGELRYVMQDNVDPDLDRTMVSADLNGDGIADFQIEIKGLIDLERNDFIL